MDKIYLDYNASTPIDAEIAKAMAPLGQPIKPALGFPAGEGSLSDGKNSDSGLHRCVAIPDCDDQRRKRVE